MDRICIIRILIKCILYFHNKYIIKQIKKIIDKMTENVNRFVEQKIDNITEYVYTIGIHSIQCHTTFYHI